MADAQSPVTETMETIDQVHLCVKTALERRAQSPMIIDVAKLTSFTDYFVLFSASSDRRVRTIAEAIRAEMKKRRILPLGVEGMDEGKWVLLDYGAFVIHIFYEELRSLFDLEGLWSDAKILPIPEEIRREAEKVLQDGF